MPRAWRITSDAYVSRTPEKYVSCEPSMKPESCGSPLSRFVSGSLNVPALIWWSSP